MKMYLYSLVFILSFVSCNIGKQNTSNQSNEAGSTVEAVSFSGKNLYQINVDSETLAKYTSLIEKSQWNENLTEEEFINLGNNYASIYQFNNAIKTYTKGLLHYPNSFKLLLYRAHRLLSVRKVDEAIPDLEKALTFMDVTNSSELEYNPDGSIKGSFEYWIYYHMGLGHYLKGNYGEAISAYKNCLKTSVTGNNKVGATYWLYNNYLKAKDNQNAEKLINEFVFEENADLNYSYSIRVLLHQGKITPEELLDDEKPSQKWTKGESSLAYDVGNWYKQNGQPEKGMSIHRKILDSPYWNIWAYVVAEKDLLTDN